MTMSPHPLQSFSAPVAGPVRPAVEAELEVHEEMLKLFGSPAQEAAPSRFATSSNGAQAGVRVLNADSAPRSVQQTPVQTPVQTLGPITVRLLPPAQGATQEQIDRFIFDAAATYGSDPNALWHVARLESGFDPNAVNNWDSNAMNGTPSQGLFQFVEGTFNAFAELARAADPAAWNALGETNWMDWRQQALTAAWAFANVDPANGQPLKQHWATYAEAEASGPAGAEVVQGTSLSGPTPETDAAPADAHVHAPAGGGTYVVQPGDTLNEIAERYGTTGDALAEANGLPNKDVIYVGQEIVVPGEVVQAEEAPASTVYVVKPLDTLNEIAAAHGTTAEAIAASNGIADVNVIQVGQELIIEGGAAVEVTAEPEPEAPATTVYVVKPLDTLNEIAAAHGTTAEAIAANNGIVNINQIEVGQELVIDGEAVAQTTEVSVDAQPPQVARSVPAGSPVDLNGASVSISQYPHGGHMAFDIAAPTGTPITASAGGTVIVSDRDDSLEGNYVMIDHGNGYYTYYGHMDYRSVDVGQQVAAGQQLGVVGSTGYSTGPHLHYEVRQGGAGAEYAIDPTPYL